MDVDLLVEVSGAERWRIRCGASGGSLGGGGVREFYFCLQAAVENYANPTTCFFHVLFKAGALAFYILSAFFFNSFVIIFVVTVLLAALDFWVVKNVSGRILVGLRWWNEINDLGESVWKFECLDQESLSRMNKKDSWLFWWTLYLTAVAWIFLGIFSVIRFQPDYFLVVGVCLTLSIANIVGFTKCRKAFRWSRAVCSRFCELFTAAFHFQTGSEGFFLLEGGVWRFGQKKC
ncbi:hypothetical protein MKW94_027662 [Papaver nudicaule]|uniref:Golgi apparatus membrane protein TVP23 n=1 Tax=Papaver nudicaule TaxID=74823 RepID=A0AA41RUF8_PAPNU|nr:hypothetical protein [Papaver nudicaule]